MNSKRPLYVVAALIEVEGKVFVAKRSYGAYEGKWEFPGGKIEKGETPGMALRREIYEELDTEIEVKELFTRVDYDYPEFFLHMYVFFASVKNGRLLTKLGIHSEEAFLSIEELRNYDFCPADKVVVERYLKAKNRK